MVTCLPAPKVVDIMSHTNQLLDHGVSQSSLDFLGDWECWGTSQVWEMGSTWNPAAMA